MSNVIRFKLSARQRETLREEACLWVVKLEGGLSSGELKALHTWLDRGPEHGQALIDAARAWDDAGVLSELADVFPLASYLPPKRRSPRRLLCLSLAAAALLCCLSFSLLQWRSNGAAQVSPTNLTYETRIGEQRTLTLTDGSVVVLNTNSQIEVAFTDAAREVFLRRGEAHFDVEKDPTRPFRVHANGGVVEAVGTAFTVQDSLTEGLEVTVVEGAVNFTPLRAADPASPIPEVDAPEAPPSRPIRPTPIPVVTEPIALSAGDSVQVRQEDEAIVKQKFRPEQLETKLAWRDGMLLFEGDPLEKVVREVSRYTAIRIDVDDAVRDIEVLGYFRTGDIDGILLTMRDTFGIKVERLSEDHIVLKADN